jgi:hypothetical protein
MDDTAPEEWKTVFGDAANQKNPLEARSANGVVFIHDPE